MFACGQSFFLLFSHCCVNLIYFFSNVQSQFPEPPTVTKIDLRNWKFEKLGETLPAVLDQVKQIQWNFWFKPSRGSRNRDSAVVDKF